MTAAATDLSSALAAVATALTTGHSDQARTHMDAIAFDWPTIDKCASVPMRQLIRIYDRDRYTCRYCGKRTVHLAVLRLLSTAHPREFPLQRGHRPVRRDVPRQGAPLTSGSLP